MVSLWESKKKNLKSKYQPFTELLTHPSKTQEGYENKNQQPFHLDEFSKEKYLRKKGGVMSLNAEVTEQAIFPTALKRCSSPKHSTEPCNQHTARHMSTFRQRTDTGNALNSRVNSKTSECNNYLQVLSLSGSPSFLSASNRFWNSVWKISRCFSMSTCSHFRASSSWVLSWR